MAKPRHKHGSNPGITNHTRHELAPERCSARARHHDGFDRDINHEHDAAANKTRELTPTHTHPTHTPHTTTTTTLTYTHYDFNRDFGYDHDQRRQLKARRHHDLERNDDDGGGTTRKPRGLANTGGINDALPRAWPHKTGHGSPPTKVQRDAPPRHCVGRAAARALHRHGSALHGSALHGTSVRHGST
jgi:hypothetical protein